MYVLAFVVALLTLRTKLRAPLLILLGAAGGAVLLR